jgi:hypothetical protein
MQSVNADDIQKEFDRASGSLIVAANALPDDLRNDFTIQKKRLVIMICARMSKVH